LRVAAIKVQGLGTGGALRGTLLQLGRFRWRRWLSGSTAAASSPASTRRKILTSDAVVVRVKTVGISRFQVFLCFLLSCKISAVVIASEG
jgi:hypothetical protein